MKKCDETITVFNARTDDFYGYDTYAPTVISGVSWYSHTKSNVTDSGLKAANETTIRIPIDADFSGKTYVEPQGYTSADPASAFTLRNGDFIVKGAETDPLTPAQAREKYGEIVTILGSTDNRRAPKGKHWRVTGA